MPKARTIEELTKAIAALPPDAEVNDPRKWYKTQQEHWLGWLSEYEGPGFYGRQTDQTRDAEYVYNHIVEPKMLMWLIEAAGVDERLVSNARRAAEAGKSMPGKSAAIRRAVPWSVLAASLWPDGADGAARRPPSGDQSSRTPLPTPAAPDAVEDPPASFDLPPVPSVDEYRRAFRALHARGALSAGHLKMLAAQYRKPDHAITAPELASAAGYKDSNGANLQYGRLGKLLREELGYREVGQASYVLSSFAPPGTEGTKHWVFYMHPEVAAALKAETSVLHV